MNLVKSLSWNFPGLEKPEQIAEHRNTVLKFMNQHRAICVKDSDEIVGVLLFSRKHNMICCLGVSENHRRKGIASILLSEAIKNLDSTRDIVVSTFCEGDPKGVAPRALYKKFGFIEGQFIDAHGYPNQMFILLANN